MKFQDILDKWKEWVGKLNESGIPMPTVRDPKTGKGSVSLTLVFMSFNLCVLSILGKASLIIFKAFHIGGLDADTANLLSAIDASQALSLFIACAGLYFGRKLTDNKGNTLGDAVSPADSSDANKQ